MAVVAGCHREHTHAAVGATRCYYASDKDADQPAAEDRRKISTAFGLDAIQCPSFCA